MRFTKWQIEPWEKKKKIHSRLESVIITPMHSQSGLCEGGGGGGGGGRVCGGDFTVLGLTFCVVLYTLSSDGRFIQAVLRVWRNWKVPAERKQGRSELESRSCSALFWSFPECAMSELRWIVRPCCQFLFIWDSSSRSFYNLKAARFHIW